MSITLFLTCILLLILINFSLSLSEKITEESYVEVVQIDKTDEQEVIKNNDNTVKSTNKAFNTAKNYKQLAHAYKTIEPPKDYKNPLLNKYKEKQSNKSKHQKSKGQSKTIKNKELTAFNGVKGILMRYSDANPESGGQESVNKNSAINYSLINRTNEYLPVPVYLCDSYGRIVVNITVNSSGLVTKATLNSSSNTKNACLIDHALEYAKESRFNASKKNSQLGTITFNFKGK